MENSIEVPYKPQNRISYDSVTHSCEYIQRKLLFQKTHMSQCSLTAALYTIVIASHVYSFDSRVGKEDAGYIQNRILLNYKSHEIMSFEAT